LSGLRRILGPLLILASGALALGGCDGEGRIRAKPAALVGKYHLTLISGSEHLELREGGTYVQRVSYASRVLEHSGTWSINNHFMGGTDVVLSNALVSDDDEKIPEQIGEMNLNVHDHGGKIALARNEVADWYFERDP